MVSHEVKAILFDWDGTLLDSVPSIRASFQFVIDSHPEVCGHLQIESILSLVGLPFRDIAKSLQLSEDEAEVMITTYRNHNRQELLKAKLFAGCLELLNELKARGYALGIVTSKARAAVAVSLDALALQNHFDVIVCQDDVARHKPDPEPLLKASEQLGLSKGEVIFIGDTTFDLDCARNFGCAAFGAAWGVHSVVELGACGPVGILEEPCELLQHLPGHGGSFKGGRANRRLSL